MTTEQKTKQKVAGLEVTNLTLRFLAEREDYRPESVFPVIVYFPQADVDEREVLWPWENLQGYREYQDRLARAHSPRVQEPVHEFLWQNPGAIECFGYHSAFQFEPDRHVRVLPLSNAMIVLANRALAEAISSIENVIAVQRDLRIGPMSADDSPDSRNSHRLIPNDPAGINRDGFTWGWRRLRLPEVRANLGLTGAGVIMGLIDKGLSEEHADLKFKVKDFAMVGPPVGLITPCHSFDHHGHGTFVAGIMAGASKSGVQLGGAPAAHVKAASHMIRDAWWSHLLTAVDWLSDPYRACQVINVSMGIYDLSSVDEQLISPVLRRMRAHRTILVGSIGNKAGARRYPARLPEVLGAGSLQPDGRTWLQSGFKPDLLLPGCDVYSCVPSGLDAYDGVSYCYKDGTSFAAPHLSAIVALLMEAHPGVAPSRIAKALKATADGAGNYHDERGWGVPDIEKALDELARCDHT